jgi:PST family polysaccharide transporter
VLFLLFVGLGYAPATALAVTPLALAVLGGTVFVSIVSATQLAELQAGGHIGDVARVRLWGSFLSVVASTILVWLFHEAGLYYGVLASSLIGIAVSTWYVRRTPRSSWSLLPLSDAAPRWRNLLQVGAGVTVGMLANTLGMLALRSIITRLGGLEAAGLFQAALTVSTANLAIVLSALTVDYLPRLSGVTQDREATRRILNDQLRVALTLAAPVIIGICSLAPWVMELLFSRSFSGGAELLRWMLIGDVLKIVSWCLGYVVLARGATLVFVSGEIIFQICSLAGTWLLYPLLGLPAIGVSYLIGYLAVLVTYSRFAVRYGAVVAPSLLILAGATCLAQLAIVFVALYQSTLAAGLGIIVTAIMIIGSLKMLHETGVINQIRERFAI